MRHIYTFIALLCVLPWASAHGQRTPQGVYLDSRDPWILAPQRLVNRQLDLQLDQTQQSGRTLSRRLPEDFNLAADAHSALRFALPGEEPGTYHGLYVFDVYSRVAPFKGLEVGFNPTFYNPSASAGYRRESLVRSGLSIFIEHPLTHIDGDPLIGRALIHDLGPVTLGRGLFLEDWPVEGNAGGLYWRGWSLDQMMLGRTIWDNDDVLVLSGGAFDRTITLNMMHWLFSTRRPSTLMSLAGGGAPTSWWGLGAEVGINLRTQAIAALWRSDLRHKWGDRASVHLGYQGRHYGATVSPNRNYAFTSLEFNPPWREYGYVTNAAEFMDAATLFPQWSHTLMFEGSLRMIQRLSFFTDIEGFYRWAGTAPDASRTFRSRADGTPLPGRTLRWFHRLGLNWQPWAGKPHRIRSMVVNKQVIDRSLGVVKPAYTHYLHRRFLFESVWALEVEVRL
ncbi:MAG: hypothetical protein ACE366_07165 [Bradymonadia bacterium]